MNEKKKSVGGSRQSEKKLTADSLQLTARAKAAMLALLLCRGLAGAQGLPEAPLTLRRAAERALALAYAEQAEEEVQRFRRLDEALHSRRRFLLSADSPWIQRTDRRGSLAERKHQRAAAHQERP